MKIAVKEVGKEVQIIETNMKYRSECVQKFIGKNYFPEFVTLNSDGSLFFSVNEDGLALELPLNFLLETTNPYFPVQKIVGTAVFIRCKYANPLAESIWDYEVDDLTTEDIAFIERILDKHYQSEVTRRF